MQEEAAQELIDGEAHELLPPASVASLRIRDSLQVVLIEDNAEDARLLREMLREENRIASILTHLLVLHLGRRIGDASHPELRRSESGENDDALILAGVAWSLSEPTRFARWPGVWGPISNWTENWVK
jgi:hypothetical protein